MNAGLCVAAVVLSYILGSVPTGLWLGLRIRGIDIREHGSRNIGATNTLRVLGKGLGIAALCFDIAKGVVPVVLLARLGDWQHLPLVCGVAAILGHSFSLFIGFRGGKGVATSAGVFLALATIPTMIAVAVFAAVLGLSHMVSAGSMCAAATLMVGVFFVDLSMPVRGVTVLVALLVLFKHRSNLGRILKGEENRLW